jgi:type IV secretion system protein TrbJ
MRTVISLLLFTWAGMSSALGQWAVVDAANLQQSVTNYAAMVEQLSRQATQIANEVRQIQQFETQLKRMGDMANVKTIVGFSEFRADLELPSKAQAWSEVLRQVDGRGLFGDSRGGVFRPIAPDFRDFDGGTIERDPAVYKQSHDLAVTVDEFKSVQADVFARRETLRRAIGKTSEALQAAETEAEQMKLQAVLDAQYGQMAALDTEISLSAAQVQVKAAESVAMNSAQSEAEAEAQRKLAQQESAKITRTFKPKYECLLQYVTERRMPN